MSFLLGFCRQWSTPEPIRHGVVAEKRVLYRAPVPAAPAVDQRIEREKLCEQSLSFWVRSRCSGQSFLYRLHFCEFGLTVTYTIKWTGKFFRIGAT